MDKLYIRVELDGTISLISTINEFVVDGIEIENYPIEFLSNFTNYLFLNGEIIEKPTPNPEDIFDYDLCSSELLKRFFYEFKIGCPLESLQIQSLIQSKQKPFKVLALCNYLNKEGGKYPIQIVDGVDVFNTYNKLNMLFKEQNIDLESYLDLSSLM